MVGVVLGVSVEVGAVVSVRVGGAKEVAVGTDAVAVHAERKTEIIVMVKKRDIDCLQLTNSDTSTGPSGSQYKFTNYQLRFTIPRMDIEACTTRGKYYSSAAADRMRVMSAALA